MTRDRLDLVVIGAGAGGLTAAKFAAKIGAHVALVESDRLGGDCTWTGCIPSKALIRAAQVAQDVRTAERFGLEVGPLSINADRLRGYVQGVVRQVADAEPPEALERLGIQVFFGSPEFQDPHALRVDRRTLLAKTFLITTGAHPVVPPVPGLGNVPYFTYRQIFDLDHVPESLVVIGGGPLGLEIAQAYQRLGSHVSIVARRLLPRDDPDAAQIVREALMREGITLIAGRATCVRRDGDAIVVGTDAAETARGTCLLIAVGRAPNVAGLSLERAGVHVTEQGIPVDDQLRTNVKHIYAAGDVLGREQFSHVAGWQAFQAARNALLPGSARGRPDPITWVTFTDPEVAQVGLTEAEAATLYAGGIRIGRWRMSQVDRARCEASADGFIKLVTTKDSRLVGATIVGTRAGDVSGELSLAIAHRMKTGEIGGTIHAYPTYATAIQQLAGELATDHWAASRTGRFVRRLMGFRACRENRAERH